jgi:hypothetical protein
MMDVENQKRRRIRAKIISEQKKYGLSKIKLLKCGLSKTILE